MTLRILAPLAALSLVATPALAAAHKHAPKPAKHMKAKAVKKTATTTTTAN